MTLTSIQTWELLSYVVTVIGLPVAIFIFAMEQRKERQNEEAEIQQTLADGYTDFLKLALEHPDLRLLSSNRTPDLSPEQAERVRAIYSVLISFFERTYVPTFQPRMNARQRRYWKSWEDLMREWCERDDFLDLLPDLLVGEDPEFVAHLTGITSRIKRG